MATQVVKKQERTIYYYGITITDLGDNSDKTNEIKDIFENIFEANSNNTNPRSLVLSRGSQHVTMDILKDTDMYLFARVGKIKPNADMQFRNTDTGERKNVLSQEELANTGVEICTYFLMDYSKGIVGFVFGQSAPTANILVNIINEYSDLYSMTLTPIVSPDSANALLRPGSQISKINYTYLIPDVSVLGHLGMDRDTIMELDDGQAKEIQLSIKCVERKPIANLTETIEKVVSFLRGKQGDDIKNISLTGRTPSSSSQNYKFVEDMLSFKINFNLEENNDGIIVALTPEELAKEVFMKMEPAYRESRDLLLLLSNRVE